MRFQLNLAGTMVMFLHANQGTGGPFIFVSAARKQQCRKSAAYEEGFHGEKVKDRIQAGRQKSVVALG